MRRTNRKSSIIVIQRVLALLVLTGLVACDRSKSEASKPASHDATGDAQATSNRIDIPSSVRQNLGIDQDPAHCFGTCEREVRSDVSVLTD